MYTIRRAAELTGVPETTLRAWERRYRVLSPNRSPAGYRLYDEQSLDTIRTMQALVRSGWAPRQAAQEVLRRLETAATGTGAATEENEPFGPLRRAAANLDAAAVSGLMVEHFSQGSFESVVDGWLMPALQAVGEDWAAGRVSVAGEHLVANAALRRLAAAYEAAARETSGPHVLVGTPPGAQHELGAFAFAVAARRAGLATTYLGSLPVPDWVTALEREHAPFVVLAVSREDDLPALDEVVEALRRTAPSVRVGVGGRFQDRAPQGAEPLGHRLGPAADRLARTLIADVSEGRSLAATNRPSGQRQL